MTGDAAAREATSSIRAITATALAFIALALIANALLRGSSLAEYWTVELADRAAYGGFGPLIVRGWLHDTHPPLFSIWATLLTTVGVTSVPAARLLSNVPPFVLMIMAGSRLSSRISGETAFHAALLLLVLSVPATVRAFGNYNADYWQVAALTMLVQIGRHIAMSGGDLRRRVDRDIIPVAIMASAGSIMLHYVGGMFGVVLSLAIILSAMAKGFRRWARLLSLSVLISGLLTVACAYVQAHMWALEIDHSWYEDQAASAGAVIAGIIFVALAHNPIPFAALKWVRDDWTKRDSAFVGMIWGALAVALLLLFEINAEKPVVAEPYMVGLPVLVCGAVAALAARLAHERKLFILFAAIAIAVVLLPFVAHGPEPRWHANAKQIGRIVATCPATTVYAASGWVLRDGVASKTARRDEPIYARGYRGLGASRGFTPRMTGVSGATQAVHGDCPTLLWIEQVPPSISLSPLRILTAARLHGLENSKLTVLRSETGLIVRSDRQ